MQRTLGLSITLLGIALGIMCAYTIQKVTFGGYIFEIGLVLAGASFVTGVYMTLID